MTETFIHKFSNGVTIELKFDLSEAMPYCKSNMRMDKQPVAILDEYRVWQNEVVVPTLIGKLTLVQMVNLSEYGKQAVDASEATG